MSSRVKVVKVTRNCSFCSLHRSEQKNEVSSMFRDPQSRPQKAKNDRIHNLDRIDLLDVIL